MNELKQMEVFGSLILGYAQACINLDIVGGKKASKLVQGIQPNNWYPLSIWKELGNIIITNYDEPSPIMEKVGIEMMTGWYHDGPGKNIVKSGVEFIHFQTGSEGYNSVVKGTQTVIGDFRLVSINEEKGSAVIESTTPFNRDMERGVLLGGIKAPGDIVYLDVNNTKNKNIFLITFYKAV